MIAGFRHLTPLQVAHWQWLGWLAFVWIILILLKVLFLGVRSAPVVIGLIGGMSILSAHPRKSGYTRRVIRLATSPRHSAWCISWGEAQWSTFEVASVVNDKRTSLWVANIIPIMATPVLAERAALNVHKTPTWQSLIFKTWWTLCELQHLNFCPFLFLLIDHLISLTYSHCCGTTTRASHGNRTLMVRKYRQIDQKYIMSLGISRKSVSCCEKNTKAWEA